MLRSNTPMLPIDVRMKKIDVEIQVGFLKFFLKWVRT